MPSERNTVVTDCFTTVYDDTVNGLGHFFRHVPDLILKLNAIRALKLDATAA